MNPSLLMTTADPDPSCHSPLRRRRRMETATTDGRSLAATEVTVCE